MKATTKTVTLTTCMKSSFKRRKKRATCTNRIAPKPMAEKQVIITVHSPKHEVKTKDKQMRKQKTIDVTNNDGLVVAASLPKNAMAVALQNMNSAQAKMVGKREQDSGQLAALVSTLENKVKKQQRKVDNNPDVKKLKELKMMLKTTVARQKENGAELELLYTNGLAHVEGDTLTEKLEAINLKEGK